MLPGLVFWHTGAQVMPWHDSNWFCAHTWSCTYIKLCLSHPQQFLLWFYVHAREDFMLCVISPPPSLQWHMCRCVNTSTRTAVLTDHGHPCSSGTGPPMGQYGTLLSTEPFKLVIPPWGHGWAWMPSNPPMILGPVWGSSPTCSAWHLPSTTSSPVTAHRP